MSITSQTKQVILRNDSHNFENSACRLRPSGRDRSKKSYRSGACDNTWTHRLLTCSCRETFSFPNATYEATIMIDAHLLHVEQSQAVQRVRHINVLGAQNILPNRQGLDFPSVVPPRIGPVQKIRLAVFFLMGAIGNHVTKQLLLLATETDWAVGIQSRSNTRSLCDTKRSQWSRASCVSKNFTRVARREPVQK